MEGIHDPVGEDATHEHLHTYSAIVWGSFLPHSGLEDATHTLFQIIQPNKGLVKFGMS